jgi:hypothetical protein
MRVPGFRPSDTSPWWSSKKLWTTLSRTPTSSSRSRSTPKLAREFLRGLARASVQTRLHQRLVQEQQPGRQTPIHMAWHSHGPHRGHARRQPRLSQEPSGILMVTRSLAGSTGTSPSCPAKRRDRRASIGSATDMAAARWSRRTATLRGGSRLLRISTSTPPSTAARTPGASFLSFGQFSPSSVPLGTARLDSLHLDAFTIMLPTWGGSAQRPPRLVTFLPFAADDEFRFQALRTSAAAQDGRRRCATGQEGQSRSSCDCFPGAKSMAKLTACPVRCVLVQEDQVRRRGALLRALPQQQERHGLRLQGAQAPVSPATALAAAPERRVCAAGVHPKATFDRRAEQSRPLANASPGWNRS